MTVTWGAPANGTVSPPLQFNYPGNGGLGGVLATANFSSNKYYYEAQPTFSDGFDFAVGWGDSINDVYGGNTSAINISNNIVDFDGSNLGSYTYTLVSGSWVALAIDLTAKLFWAYNLARADGWNDSGTANPATGAGGYSFSGATNYPWFPGTCWNSNNSGENILANFGATAFQGVVPSGFSPVQSSAPVMMSAGMVLM
jgi:hypothetical protein